MLAFEAFEHISIESCYSNECIFLVKKNRQGSHEEEIHTL